MYPVSDEEELVGWVVKVTGRDIIRVMLWYNALFRDGIATGFFISSKGESNEQYHNVGQASW
jgi:hypothetical protein